MKNIIYVILFTVIMAGLSVLLGLIKIPTVEQQKRVIECMKLTDSQERECMNQIF